MNVRKIGKKSLQHQDNNESIQEMNKPKIQKTENVSEYVADLRSDDRIKTNT